VLSPTTDQLTALIDKWEQKCERAGIRPGIDATEPTGPHFEAFGAEYQTRSYVGLYRGVVTATAADDPAGLGRIQISVPEFDKSYIAWAALSVPVGSTTGAVTPIGVRVWVQFEHGDIRRPVVTGAIVG
jgi:hypothetical protein